MSQQSLEVGICNCYLRLQPWKVSHRKQIKYNSERVEQQQQIRNKRKSKGKKTLGAICLELSWLLSYRDHYEHRDTKNHCHVVLKWGYLHSWLLSNSSLLGELGACYHAKQPCSRNLHVPSCIFLGIPPALGFSTLDLPEVTLKQHGAVSRTKMLLLIGDMHSKSWSSQFQRPKEGDGLSDRC